MKLLVKLSLLLPVMMFTYDCYCQTEPIAKVNRSFKEILKSDKWITDNILGLDAKIEKYELTKYHPITKFAGIITQFMESSSFHSEYISWCGTDYFTKASGKYKFLDKDKIAVAVETVSYSGEWEKPKEQRETKYLTYVVSISGDTIFLPKQD
jgi:glucosamine 6-phosphate synthetase-like amidotransferase/phosphosugar isomerase protein